MTDRNLKIPTKEDLIARARDLAAMEARKKLNPAARRKAAARELLESITAAAEASSRRPEGR